MTNEEIWHEITTLPPEGRKQAEDFLAFLRQRYAASAQAPTLDADWEKEAFVGMWRDREEMADSAAWVRNLRQTAWRRQRG
jgi:hypothetical protein